MRLAFALFFAGFFTLFSAKSFGQKSEKARGWSVETNIGGGQILKHTRKINIGTNDLVSSQEISFDYQTFGKKSWQAWKKYPRFGITLAHFDLGKAAHGHLFGTMPTLTAPLFEGKKMGLDFRVGAGAAWVSRPFDYLKNPSQNAIGSHLNILVQFRLAARFELSKKVALLAGGAFTHASNGASALPNFGVNVSSLFVAGQFSHGFLSKKDFLTPDLTKKISSRRPRARLGATVSAGIAWQESQTFDGPKFPVYSASAAAAWSLHRANRVLLGLDYELHRSVQFFIAHSKGEDENLEKYRTAATRWAVFLGDEIWYGPVAIQISAGFYVSRKSEMVDFFMYNKLATRWHFRPSSRARPFVGVVLKSHLVIAEYVAATAGMAF